MRQQLSRDVWRGTVVVAVAVVAAVLGLSACGEDAEPTQATAFGRALGTLGEGVSPGGGGFGWVDVEAVGAGNRGVDDWAGDALGPGADDLLEEQLELRARTGLDLSTASQALSVVGSYAFGVRIDGVKPDELERRYRQAGAAAAELDDWTAFDLGDQAHTALGSRLEALGGLGARAAVMGDAVILARYGFVRRALAGGGPSPLSDPAVSFAVGCLGEVVAARTQRGSHTYNRSAAPDLLAVGARAPSDSQREEVICALDDSEEAVNRYASSLERTLVPDGRDEVTGEPFKELASRGAVDTLAEGELHAARAELTLDAGREPLVFEALNRGSVLTYLGAPAPVPND